jgi:hypothetical protein
VGRHVACIGEGEVFTGFWFGGPKGRKRPLGRCRRMWEDNIKVDVRLAQDRFQW